MRVPADIVLQRSQLLVWLDEQLMHGKLIR